MRVRLLIAPLAALVACSTACSGSAGSSGPSRQAAAPAPAVQAGTPADWPTYHGSTYRGGNARTMPAASGTPTVLTKLALDGQVYASPIVVGGVTVVATENDTVYAFDSSLHQLWKQHLGTPSPASQRPCGNIDPLGITGTPTYDPVHHSVYVAPEYSGSPPRHELVSLHLSTGGVIWHKSIDLPGVDPAAMQQRGALTTLSTRVWVPFGGLAGDCGAYKGRVVGLGRGNGSDALAYTVPTSREAGIWTPPGPAVDNSGRMYVAVGNGESGVGDAYDHSDSVLEISSSAALRDSFSPTTWPTDNDADLDLGSQGPTIVGSWIFSAGKSGTAYVLGRYHLGGIGGQVSKASICKSFGGTAVDGTVVYVPCTDGIRAVNVDSSGGMHVLWHAASSITGSPVIGGGRIWSLDPGAGVLYALNPSTGATVSSVAVGTTTRFATPAIYGADLYVPTTSGVTVVRSS